MLATKYGVFKGHVAGSFHYFSMSDISEQPRKKQKVDHLVSQLRESISHTKFYNKVEDMFDAYSKHL